MANMSYCRFQNTLSDLQDCYEAIANADGDDELSKEEEHARKALIEMCGDIFADFEHEVENNSF